MGRLGLGGPYVGKGGNGRSPSEQVWTCLGRKVCGQAGEGVPWPVTVTNGIMGSDHMGTPSLWTDRMIDKEREQLLSCNFIECGKYPNQGMHIYKLAVSHQVKCFRLLIVFIIQASSVFAFSSVWNLLNSGLRISERLYEEGLLSILFGNCLARGRGTRAGRSTFMRNMNHKLAQ